MIVGAGIGVTPCASIMKGVVGYRWKKGFTPNHLHFFWVARLTDLRTFKWLLVMLPELKAQELVHNEYYGGDEGGGRTLTITLYITGCKPEALKYEANPKPNSTGEIINALQDTKNPNTGEPYLRLKAGRPDWDSEYKELAGIYGRADIGVIFCGAPMIAAALKSSCEKLSDKEKTVFRLHKENF